LSIMGNVSSPLCLVVLIKSCVLPPSSPGSINWESYILDEKNLNPWIWYWNMIPTEWGHLPRSIRRYPRCMATGADAPLPFRLFLPFHSIWLRYPSNTCIIVIRLRQLNIKEKEMWQM
jgi:hypothetical protein